MTQVVDAPDATGWEGYLHGSAFSLQPADMFPWTGDAAAVLSPPVHHCAPSSSRVADALGAVRLAAARQESLQWELDAAQLALVEAIRNAAAAGAAVSALCLAADMTESELEDVLK
ncbi:hypothetical protein [Arthrobacter crystallopoietes]|uniref:Uncharacterized protein n=1 Tax=Crystallibacter crystallopoietes TaxID=37928 RepID=A0A1H0ZPL5_9MICC|nr:hypothetical protein [Arthrobacter crystallopoietes]SDQ29289.1 hypothetical protein SAMN04489742_0486 [Arthrobacter crystallopoietes]